MDPTRDNPIIRFTTFWWGLGTFLLFALLLAVIWMFNRQAPESLEDVVAKARYETQIKIAQAQAASLSPAAIEAAIPAVAGQLVAAKPAAVAKPEQLVPVPVPATKAAGSSAVAPALRDAALAVAEPVDFGVMETGKALSLICASCHGRNFTGGRFVGPVGDLIRIQLRGMQGRYPVKGVAYDFATGLSAPPNFTTSEYRLYPGMPAFAFRTDEQIAAVLTYVRNSFGNKASVVTAAQVAMFRSEVGKPQLTTQELTQQ